jgi:hypothetical protein
MLNNIHVSYDLKNPGRDYAKVINKIASLGATAKIHYSFWYLSTSLSAEQVRNALLGVIDKNDSIYVADATNNHAAWHNIAPEVALFIHQNWGLRRVA